MINFVDLQNTKATLTWGGNQPWGGTQQWSGGITTALVDLTIRSANPFVDLQINSSNSFIDLSDITAATLTTGSPIGLLLSLTYTI